MNKFIKERIEENKSLFTKQEMGIIRNNFGLVKKLYVLGFINCKDTYL